MTPLLLHGQLGYWDEVIFIAVIAVFLVIMGLSWWRSNQADDSPMHDDEASPQVSADSNASFKLD